MASRLTQTKLTDTDLYFLTTGNVVQQKFPGIQGKFHLFSRNRKPMIISDEFLGQLKQELIACGSESVSKDVANYISTQHPQLTSYMDSVIHTYHMNPTAFNCSLKDGSPDIYWQGSIATLLNYEATVSSILTELYTTTHGITPKAGWDKTLMTFAKAMKENGIPFTEGGTRRRLSRAFHKEVLTILKEEAGPFLKATSNANLAYELNLPCYGTYPHAYVQLMAAIYGYKAANLMALIHWSDVYRGAFASFLPDTFTTPIGLAAHEEFETLFPSRFGIFRTFRNDSLPYNIFVDNYMIPYAEKRGIAKKDITIIHSDGMDLESTVKAADYTRKTGFNVSFIIGTYLTYTVSGHEGFDLAAKLEEVRVAPSDQWIPVCKLSDSNDKQSGPGDSVVEAKKALHLS